MSAFDAHVTVLTPPGVSAIAVLQIEGADAWAIVQKLFRPNRGRLPESPPLHRFWFGRFGSESGDEVILSVPQIDPVLRLEIHCHGGRQVVTWLQQQLQEQGCRIGEEKCDPESPWQLLPRARTLKTASILLDQCNGAFVRALDPLLEQISSNNIINIIESILNYETLGRHLVQPFRVVVAGAPNVGKSSLINAIAGFERCIVSAVPGTTRDLVSVPIAIEGWPVDIADTAGLRQATEALEAEGIALAREFLATADQVVWVIDATEETPIWPESGTPLLVANKCDARITTDLRGALPVSARTGEGLPALLQAIARRLVPNPPPPGAAVPFTAAIAKSLRQARELVASGDIMAARSLLTPIRDSAGAACSSPRFAIPVEPSSPS